MLIKNSKICKKCKYGSMSSDEKTYLGDYEYVYDEDGVFGWDLVSDIKGIEYSEKYKDYFKKNEFLVSCLREDWDLGNQLEVSEECVMQFEYEVLK